MTDIHHLENDLSFVRQAIERRRQVDPREARIYLVWAVYILVGYALLDLDRLYADWFFFIGGFAAAFLSYLLGRSAAIQRGELDRSQAGLIRLHWLGGIACAVAGSFALAAVIPPLRGFYGAQIGVFLFGMIYFFHGVHFDFHFLWLGPLLMLGAIVVGFIPVYPWTCLGIVFAVGLTIPYLFARKHHA